MCRHHRVNPLAVARERLMARISAMELPSFTMADPAKEEWQDAGEHGRDIGEAFDGYLSAFRSELQDHARYATFTRRTDTAVTDALAEDLFSEIADEIERIDREDETDPDYLRDLRAEDRAFFTGDRNV